MRVFKLFLIGLVLSSYAFGAQAIALWVSITHFGGNHDGWILLGTCVSIAVAALAASFAAPRLTAKLREAVTRNFLRNLFWRPEG